MDTGDEVQSIPPPLPDSPGDRLRWGVGWAAAAYFGFWALQVIPAFMAGAVYGVYCVIRKLPLPREESDFPITVLGGAAIVSHLLLILFIFFLVRFVHGIDFRRGISWNGKKPFAAWKAIAVSSRGIPYH